MRYRHRDEFVIDDEAGPSLEEAVSGGALLPEAGEESSTRVRMFESLEDPSFRWFFAALTSQMASLNMQILVRGVLVFELTNSYSALGLVSLANAVPGIALSLAGGIVADRARSEEAGALWVATLPPKRRGQLYLIASLLQGIALIAFSASSWFWVSVPIMLVLGLGQVGRQSFGNVLVQQYTDDAYRGRVMSIYMLQFSLTSLGAFLVGLLASAIGAQEALGGTSIALVLCAIFCLAFIPRLRNLQ